jgi:hypothetical protein
VIQIWQAFSCNNSAGYRLIARFDDEDTARATAAELAEYFEAQEKLGDHRYQAGPLATLARTYGFDWADGGAGYDGPGVIVEGTTLIVYHAYCLGLGPGVAAYLSDRGGRPEQQSALGFHVSVLFRAPADNPRFDEELAKMFGQPLDDERNARPMTGPWVKQPTNGRVVFVRDAGTIGMWFPCDPDDLGNLKTWLADHGIDRAVIRIQEFGDEDLFLALAKARCSACDGLLEYLDPKLHDIETPQLLCKPCGGLYELSAFLSRPA